MKLKKKILISFIIILPLLFSSVFATWIIMKNVGLTPSYDPNAKNIFMEQFDGQSVDYTGGMQTPKSSMFKTGDLIFKHRKAYSDDEYKKDGPFDAGTYEILIQSNNDSINYSDTVVLFTVNPIAPTIATSPTVEKPTIEGEQPKVKSGVVNGLSVDGTLTGTWSFDLEDLKYGVQQTDSITVEKPCTFIPESENYTAVSTNLSLKILAVAKNSGNYYGTVEDAIDKASGTSNIFVISNIYDKTEHYPTIKRANLTIPSNVTLTLTYRNDDYTTGYKIYADGESISTVEHLSTYGAQLCVSSSTTITLNGKITIGAYVGSSSTVHSKEFAVLMNNGTINSESGSVINAYGYMKGSGTLNVKSNSTVNDLFRIYDFAGGRYAPGIFYKSMKKKSIFSLSFNFEYNYIMPFNCYSIHNISCKSNIYYGSKYIARSQINISNTIYVNEIILIGSKGLFEMKSNYITRTIKEIDVNHETGYKSFDNSNYIISNQSINQVENYDFYGEIFDNNISISLYIDVKLTAVDLTINTSTNVAMPISTMHFNFKEGSKGTFSACSYKFLPGSKVTVDHGASLTFSSSTNIVIYSDYYDDFIQVDGNDNQIVPSGFSYYKNRINLYVNNEQNVLDKYKSYFEIKGQLTANGGFGGNVYKHSSANLSMSKESATINWLTKITYLAEETVVKLGLTTTKYSLGGEITTKTTPLNIVNV